MNTSWIPAACYALTVVAANLATNAFGLVTVAGLAVTAGTFFAGLALVLRDYVQRQSGKRAVVVAIVIGAGLSAGTAGASIALASGLAFLVSELVDLWVYTPLARRNRAQAVLVSSIVAAPVDTILFLQLAGFGVTPTALAGQFIVKTAIAVCVVVGLSWRSTSRVA